MSEMICFNEIVDVHPWLKPLVAAPDAVNWVREGVAIGYVGVVPVFSFRTRLSDDQTLERGFEFTLLSGGALRLLWTRERRPGLGTYYTKEWSLLPPFGSAPVDVTEYCADDAPQPGELLARCERAWCTEEQLFPKRIVVPPSLPRMKA